MKRKKLERYVLKLAVALMTHTRTDLAPDAALGDMRKLVKKLKKKVG